jgi:hypothetical protein
MSSDEETCYMISDKAIKYWKFTEVRSLIANVANEVGVVKH